MSGPNTRIFLSCVTAEFEAPDAPFPGFREKLRHYLSKADYLPKIQEDLPLTDADTVLKMARVIRSCGAVIHLVGSVPGAVAHPKAVAEFLATVPTFLVSHPELRIALGDCLDLTYTQWEAFLALHYGVSLRVYATTAGATAQAEHLRRLRLGRKYPGDRHIAEPADLLGQLIGDLKDTATPAPTPTPLAQVDRWFWASRSEGNDGTGLSRLAVAESLLATAVFVVLVVVLGWYVLLLTAVLVVPFALLRTDESDRHAVDYARRMLASNTLVVTNLDRPGAAAGAMSEDIDNQIPAAWRYSVKVLVVVAVARLGALLVALFRDFWGSIGTMPRNWLRVCLSTDILRPVELLPGSPEYPAYTQEAMRLKGLIVGLARFREPWPAAPSMLLFWCLAATCWFFFEEGYDSAKGWMGVKMVGVCVAIGYAPFILAYVVAFWYRWSLKSTSVVWLPLLYIAADVTARGWSAERRLSRAVHSRFAGSMRRFGVASSAAVVGWVGLRAVGVTVHPMLAEFSPAIEHYFGGPAVIAVASWSVASVINTGLAWFVYWWADIELERRQHGEGRPDETVLRRLKTVTLIRWGLFAFSWACSFWVAVQIAAHSKGIPIAPRWVPW